MKLRARVLTRLPATLKADGGLKVSKVNGVWTFEPAFEQLTLIDSQVDITNKQVWTYDDLTGVYNRVRLPLIVEGVARASRIDIRDYGAIGDGLTDCAAAIQAALDEAKASKRAVYVPAGDYVVKSSITTSDWFCVIEGDGRDVSRVLVSHSGTAISFNATNMQYSFSLRGVGIIAQNGFFPARALDLSFPDTVPPAPAPRLDQINVMLEDFSFVRVGAAWWASSAVRMTNAINPIVARGIVEGSWDDTPRGISLGGQCLDISVSQVKMSLVQDAIWVGGSSEGLRVVDAAIVGVDRGVVAVAGASQEPDVTVMGSHINAKICCIDLEDYTQASISGNLLYATPANGSPGWSGIKVRGVVGVAHNISLVGNRISKAAYPGPTVGMDIDAVDGIDIIGNRFLILDTGIQFGATATGRNVLGNGYRTVTQQISYNGTEGVEPFSVNSASAARGVEVVGSVSASPRLRPKAPATLPNVGIYLSGIGSGIPGMQCRDFDVLYANAPASPVSGITINAAATGGDVEVLARSASETNVNLRLSPKGSGKVVSAAGLDVTGYFLSGSPLAAADIGAQPSDGDLTAIAALSTQTYGRSLLTLSSSRALAASAKAPYAIAASAVAVPNTGTTTENVLATVTISANTMGANGQLRVYALWSNNNSANGKTTRIRWGGLSGSVVGTVTSTTQISYAEQRSIANRNATNSQVLFQFGSGGLGQSSSAVTTATLDTTTDQTIVFTSQLGNSADTQTLESYLVELIVP